MSQSPETVRGILRVLRMKSAAFALMRRSGDITDQQKKVLSKELENEALTKLKSFMCVELVPEEDKSPYGCGPSWNDCRALMLRNIEEKVK